MLPRDRVVHQRAHRAMSAALADDEHPASIPPPPDMVRDEVKTRAERAPHPADRRSAKELLAAAKEFQKEDRARSWFHVVETFGVFFALTAAIVFVPSWARLPLSLITGL